MTNAQTARLEGFNASLTERGVSLQVYPAGATFTALVERIAPESAEFAVGSDVEREGSRIHVLRTSKPATFKPGATLYDAAAARYHRIQRVEDHPANILVIGYCETTEGT